MDRVLECILNIDRAMLACHFSDRKDKEALATALYGLVSAIKDTEQLLGDEEVLLSIHDAILLLNDLQAVCKHFIIYDCFSLASEVFHLQYLISSRLRACSEEFDRFFAALKEKLESLESMPQMAGRLEPFLDATIQVELGSTPCALALRSQLLLRKAKFLMRRGEWDTAMFILMEGYSSLADSASQQDMEVDQARLQLLHSICCCLEVKNNPHLAQWIRHRIDNIKARNKREVDSLIGNGADEKSTPLPERWPCAAFAMKDAQAAYEHLSDYKVAKRYGKGKTNHWYFTWDDGGRVLGVCPKCRGYVLVQKSECHGEEDSYYTDYFQVSGPKEAEALNEKYDGWEIEEHFQGRFLIESGGPASWYDLHLRKKADQESSTGDK